MARIALFVFATLVVSSALACQSTTDEGERKTPPKHDEEVRNAGARDEAAIVASKRLALRGANLSGAEFGNALPGVEGIDYRFPTSKTVDYYLAKGMNAFRIPFLWERLQPTAQDELDATYAAHLEELVAYASSKGARVILEPHNFARYYGTPIGSDWVTLEMFADFWRRIAVRQKHDSNVAFNLVNEPNSMPTEQWVSAANAAIGAIREAGATNTILVPGNAWTGAHTWDENWYGTPNAIALLDVVDPGKNVVFEAHQYLDTTSSGTSNDCVSQTIGSERLAPFLRWLRAHGKRGFVGEFAAADNATCRAALKDMLRTMADASDVLDGWLWWGAGPWWGEDYPFSVEPLPSGDRPLMSMLAPYLGTR